MPKIVYPAPVALGSTNRLTTSAGVETLQPGEDATAATRVKTTSDEVDIIVQSPLSVSGLVYWLDPSPVRLFTDTGGTTAVVNDGDLVKAWTDRLAGIIVSEGTNPPTYKVNILVGYPAIRFDGTNDVLRTDVATSLLNAAGGVTCFVAHTPQSVDVATQHVIMTISEGVTITASRLSVSENVTTAGSVRVQMMVADGGASTNSTSGGGKVLTATPSIFTSRLSLTGEHKAQTWVNGTSAAGPADIGAADGPFSATNSLRLTIGASAANTPATFFNGDLFELLIFNRALTTTERVQIERYLGRKYSITVV